MPLPGGTVAGGKATGVLSYDGAGSSVCVHGSGPIRVTAGVGSGMTVPVVPRVSAFYRWVPVGLPGEPCPSWVMQRGLRVMSQWNMSEAVPQYAWISKM